MWATDLAEILERQPCVVVTLADIAGSAPRALGTRMLVTGAGTRGSIGGGNLEYRAIEAARLLLEDAAAGTQRQELFGLGPELNQCCGGAVTLTYEVLRAPPEWLQRLVDARAAAKGTLVLTAIDEPVVTRWLVEPGDSPVPGLAAEVADFAATEQAAPRVVKLEADRYLLESARPGRVPLVLFGAGHVGSAVADVLVSLPFAITWLDSRPGQFEACAIDAGKLPRLRQVECPDPAAWVAQCPAGAVYLVMTHSHQLDEDICFEVLQRGDAAWLGLIGSATKRKRFVHRLARRGVPQAPLERLVCPIGLAGITGKRPATIAVAVAAQLLEEAVPAACR